MEAEGAARPQIVGAIDAGTNSVHLLVAAASRKRIRPITDERVFVRLGAAVERGHLGPAGDDLVAAIARYADLAVGLGATRIAILGTEPLRRVADADDIAGRIERITGIPLDVLSHEEEGLLTLLGVTRGDPIEHELLVVDVGGGSSELVFAGPGREPVAIGLRLGSARLIERHADHDPPTWAEIAAMRAAADDALTRTPRQELDEMVVVGGGATNLLRVVPSAAQDRCLDKRRIHRAVGRLLGEPSAAAAARHGIHPVRAHTLPAAAAILMSLLERFEVATVRVSDASLREGALIALSRAGRAWRAELASLVNGTPANAGHNGNLAVITPA